MFAIVNGVLSILCVGADVMTTRPQFRVGDIVFVRPSETRPSFEGSIASEEYAGLCVVRRASSGDHWYVAPVDLTLITRGHPAPEPPEAA